MQNNCFEDIFDFNTCTLINCSTIFCLYPLYNTFNSEKKFQNREKKNTFNLKGIGAKVFKNQ